MCKIKIIAEILWNILDMIDLNAGSGKCQDSFAKYR